MSWNAQLRDSLLALWLLLWTSIAKGSRFIARIFKPSSSFLELPLATSNATASRLSVFKVHARRFVGKPIVKLYHVADNFIFQTYGYLVWNSPRYIAQFKKLVRRARALVSKYMSVKRPHPPLERPRRHISSTLGLSTTVTVRDSIWTDWGTKASPEDANEWTFYIRGCGDQQGMTITQGAWKGYQDYIQRLGLPLVESPSRVTVKDFEAYEAAVALVGRMLSDSPILDICASPSPCVMGIYSDAPLSSFGTLLASSPGSMVTLSQSPLQCTLDAKLGFKDINTDVANIVSDSVLYPAEVATPLHEPLPVVHEDTEDCKNPSVESMPKKHDIGQGSIKSFGDIEALLVENFGVPVPDTDRVPSPHSVYASSSIYSQDSAGSDQISIVNPRLLDIDVWQSLRNYACEEDDCAQSVLTVTLSDAYCQGRPISEDDILAITPGPVFDSCLDQLDLDSDDIADDAGQLTICRLEDHDNGSPGAANDSNILSPQVSDADDDDFSYMALEEDNIPDSFYIVSSPPTEAWMPAVSEVQCDYGTSRYPLETQRSSDNRRALILSGLAFGAAAYDLSPTCPKFEPISSDIESLNSETDALSQIHRASWVTYRPPSPVLHGSPGSARSSIAVAQSACSATEEKFDRQQLPNPHSISPESFSTSFFGSPVNPDISHNRTVAALEHIERRRVRISYYVQRELEEEYGSPAPQHRRDIPF